MARATVRELQEVSPAGFFYGSPRVSSTSPKNAPGFTHEAGPSPCFPGLHRRFLQTAAFWIQGPKAGSYPAWNLSVFVEGMVLTRKYKVKVGTFSQTGNCKPPIQGHQIRFQVPFEMPFDCSWAGINKTSWPTGSWRLLPLPSSITCRDHCVEGDQIRLHLA